MAIDNKITKVCIELGRTVNLGNFESYHIRIRMEADFQEGEYSDERYEELRTKVSKKVGDQVMRILPQCP